MTAQYNPSDPDLPPQRPVNRQSGWGGWWIVICIIVIGLICWGFWGRGGNGGANVPPANTNTVNTNQAVPVGSRTAPNNAVPTTEPVR